MKMAVLALMIVCFVDVMGQGLAFPIFNQLMLQTGSGFLPAGTTEDEGEKLYGIAVWDFLHYLVLRCDLHLLVFPTA